MDRLNIWGITITKDKDVIEIRYNPNAFKNKILTTKHGMLQMEIRKLPKKLCTTSKKKVS